MMSPQARTKAFRELAADLEQIDIDVYNKHGADPLHPVLGEGHRLARVCIFGRDPGRDEVRWQEPFIGAGGQKVRQALYRKVHGQELPDFEASRAIGGRAFWANTVPYKPVGNKAWSMKVRKAFQPTVAELLVHGWAGRDVICLGQNAFLWFGIGQDRQVRAQLKAAWSDEPRFAGDPVHVQVATNGGATADLRIWPMAHPSPLNATWFKRFPDLLDARLERIGWSEQTWQLSQADARP